MKYIQEEVYELIDLEILIDKFHLYDNFVSVIADDTELEYSATGSNEIMNMFSIA